MEEKLKNLKKYNITITNEDLEKFDSSIWNNIDKCINAAIEASYYKEEFIIMQRIICIQYEKIKELEKRLERRSNAKTRARSSRVRGL